MARNHLAMRIAELARTLAVTSDLPHRLGELQNTLHQGPCLDAATGEDSVVRTDDFRIETRWPDYSRVIVELGVLSGLSFKLYTSERSAGALNLFGFRPTTWDEECQAAAPTVTRNSAELNSALATRDLIGQAKGIIMERFAIDMLRRLSQESNTKLVDIAQRLIETRAGG